MQCRWRVSTQLRLFPSLSTTFYSCGQSHNSFISDLGNKTGFSGNRTRIFPGRLREGKIRTVTNLILEKTLKLLIMILHEI
jgi:hypothetical protein